MKNLIIATLLIISFTANSQIVKYNLPPKSYYKSANITMKDFKKYDGMKVYIKSDSISFVNANSELPLNISLSKVDYIRVNNGNQALVGAGLGALLMGLSALNSVVQNPGYSNGGSFVIGFTVSGAVIGGLIGVFILKKKTYYIDY